MLGYLSADITCFEKRTVFRERSSRKTGLRGTGKVQARTNIRAYFCAKWKLLCLWSFKSFSRSFENWEIFGHVTFLDQSRASEIIWLVIMNRILRENIKLCQKKSLTKNKNKWKTKTKTKTHVLSFQDIQFTLWRESKWQISLPFHIYLNLWNYPFIHLNRYLFLRIDHFREFTFVYPL